MARTAEIAALAVIALLLAAGGRTLLAMLAAHRAVAAPALAVLIVLALGGLRRIYRAPDDDARAVITKNVAYVVAAALALWDVLAAAKWLPGACIAAAEVALVFDMLTIAARRRVAGTH
ncbi:MAG: hypothetical protein ABR591_12535 [Candidatus Velthaea sp.]